MNPPWFKINPAQFLADTAVDAMTTLELGACFRLLCRQWIDGTIPDDLGRLARLARLDPTAMGEAWVTLCHFFPVVETGKRANRHMWIEREKVSAEMEKRRDEGTKSALKRWGEARNQSDATPNGSPIPAPTAEAMQEEDKDIYKSSSEPKSGSNGKVSPSRNPKKAKKHAAFKALLQNCYEYLNPGEEMPWDGSDAKQLDSVAKSVPTLDEDKFHKWLLNYAASENINPADRPRVFLPRINSYGNGPLDKFGRPKAGRTLSVSKVVGSALENERRVLEEAGVLTQ
jgi:hypothetical protein